MLRSIDIIFILISSKNWNEFPCCCTVNNNIFHLCLWIIAWAFRFIECPVYCLPSVVGGVWSATTGRLQEQLKDGGTLQQLMHRDTHCDTHPPLSRRTISQMNNLAITIQITFKCMAVLWLHRARDRLNWVFVTIVALPPSAAWVLHSLSSMFLAGNIMPHLLSHQVHYAVVFCIFKSSW